MFADTPRLDDPYWTAIQPIATRQRAERWQFVLHALGMESWVVRVPEQSFYALMVPTKDVERAVAELSEYEQENRERVRERRKKDIPLYRRNGVALMLALGIALFFSVTGPVANHSTWFQHGIADSHAIMHGAVYQSVTALTLHATPEHVMGNAVVGGLFWLVSNRRFGQGLGTFLIVTTGAAGNLVNAAFHDQWLHEHHRSLGASTAVMAALGLVVAAQLLTNHTKKAGIRSLVLSWGPLFAGLVLLGIFGSSATSDLYAHGFGFLSGLLGGLIATAFVRRRTQPLSIWVQGAFGSAALVMVVGAWAGAFGFVS